MIYIIMGVSGAGKSTIGELLAEKLHCLFHDADEDHSLKSKEKMRNGIPLTDEDRRPWLDILQKKIKQWLLEEKTVVLACSALKKSYRNYLQVDPAEVQFIYLKTDLAATSKRLAHRQHHFLAPQLLESQFTTLEEPSAEEAWIVDGNAQPEEIVSTIQNKLC